MNIRKTLFWVHLIFGCGAALFIFLMSLTGVVLTYERQIINAAAQSDYPLPPEVNAQRLSLDELAIIALDYPTKKAPKVVLTQGQNAPVMIKDGRKTIAHLNPFSGAEIAPPAAGVKSFFAKVRAFHRWLTLDGKFSQTGRWINGVANVMFILLIISGIYLWLPKRLNLRAFRKRLTLTTKHPSVQSRNDQWHHVFGFYMAPILLVLAVTAIFFSFKWPGQALEQYVSKDMIALPKPMDTAARVLPLASQLKRVEQQFPQWRTLSLPISAVAKDMQVFEVDNGNGGEPQKRVSVVVNTVNGELMLQRFEQQSNYRKARGYIRFLHTGEAFGIIGQTLAGLASLFACLLVYTGVMLSWRRWQNSRR
ncbi:PepSY-associated TM helix domain-containing protein [Shewanella gelidii]|uniref:PepSY domain-containing protein n=1 Tax=Shewanella gelidii TaxID=1642821 RepID=A0A917JPN7_9GAMM|nr:PepSY-associated TM helix domain-containing protein [Shewanella gelidii]MCL1097643.1 PepSY domain-containing protein [Shewanella gelidii]GGI79979.1 hypothetical protein GCM10009332_16640 [Shewanella gelidii]